MNLSLKQLAAIAVLLGACFGSLMVYVAWDFNPQCAFHCAEQGIAWKALLLIGAVWTMAGSIVAFPVLAGLAWLARQVSSRMRHAADK